MRTIFTPGYFARKIRGKMKKPRVQEGIKRKADFVEFKKKDWGENKALSSKGDFDYSYYDYLMRPLWNFFGKQPIDMVSALCRIRGNSNRALEIMDDGAGTGKAMEELRKKLSEKGIPARITALSLEPNEWLAKRHDKGIIDELVIGPAERFTPRRKFDAIFSVFGSMEYVADALKREHVLKLAHSLRKGGLMMAVFDLSVSNPPRSSGITRRQLDSVNHRKPFKNRKFLEIVKSQFRKYGFRAEFYNCGDSIWTLLAQRER